MNKQYKLMKEFELAKAILKNGNGDDDEPNLGNEEWPSPGYTDYSDYDRDMDDMEDERNQLLDQGDYHREGMEKIIKEWNIAKALLEKDDDSARYDAYDDAKAKMKPVSSKQSPGKVGTPTQITDIKNHAAQLAAHKAFYAYQEGGGDKNQAQWLFDEFLPTMDLNLLEKNEGDGDSPPPRRKIAIDVWGNEHEFLEGEEPPKRKFKPWTPDSPYSSYEEGSSMDPNVEAIQNSFLKHKHGSY